EPAERRRAACRARPQRPESEGDSGRDGGQRALDSMEDGGWGAGSHGDAAGRATPVGPLQPLVPPPRTGDGVFAAGRGAGPRDLRVERGRESDGGDVIVTTLSEVEHSIF